MFLEPMKRPPQSDPFAPALHGLDPEEHMQGMAGLGDLVERIAKPIAKWIDDQFGTDLEHCEGCAGRKTRWNQSIPFRSGICKTCDPRTWSSQERRGPRPWKRIEPQYARAVVYPWLSTAAKWEELRYSLRSLHAHFQDRTCPIVILGDAPPPWLNPRDRRVTHIRIDQYQQSAEAGLFEAFQQGMQIASEVVWMNDDIYLLAPLDWGYLETAVHEGSLIDKESSYLALGSTWGIAIATAIEEMKRRGRSEIWRFATHTPYRFELEKAREIFDTYWLAYKGSWVTLYHNHHQTPCRAIGEEKTMRLPNPAARYLNHQDAGPDRETKRQLLAAFPDPAPWEF